MADLTESQVERLLEAYDAADNDAVKESIADVITEAATPAMLDLEAMYPSTVADHNDVDAEEIVDELEEEATVDEAIDILNEQSPHGGVIEAHEPMYGELYVYDPNLSPDQFDTPKGWRAFKTDNGHGVGFTNSSRPQTVDELAEWLRNEVAENTFHVSEDGPAEYSQVYFVGDHDILPEGWVTDEREDVHGDYVRHDVGY